MFGQTLAAQKLQNTLIIPIKCLYDIYVWFCNIKSINIAFIYKSAIVSPKSAIVPLVPLFNKHLFHFRKWVQKAFLDEIMLY